MRDINIKVVLIAITLLAMAFSSFLYWNNIAPLIMNALDSKIFTFGIWVTLSVTALIHFQRNKAEDKNLISDKEGLEKPIEYIQFVFTFGAIGTSIQVLAKESFTYLNFPNQYNSGTFQGIDIASFFIVIAVLVFYSYGKIKPIILETYVEKSKVSNVRQ